MPATDNTSPAKPGLRAVWTALILIVAVLVGAAAGLLTFAGGANLPTAVLAGGGGFAGTVFLLLGLYRFASGDRE